MDIQGKTALITGGAQRVGRALTLALARAGANVVINYHNSKEAALATAQEASTFGVQTLAIGADISDHRQVLRMAEEVSERFGGVEVLVNSASIFKATPFPNPDITDWLRVTGVLINGAYYCANAFAPYMLQKGEGVIINIVDLSAWEPWPDFSAHSVGKAALLALTRQLALELAPKVRVNAIAPGPVLPPLNYSPERIARTAEKTLLGRWGSPEDVCKALLFLIESDYITGQAIIVDGGEFYGHRKLEPA
ncbi:MAG: SDR family oxidoreductase [Anaerolineales bacterium]|nr:SDR family oxidoreductase [Anaerolineales bacterium]MCS7248142.1 SDR family oxidoreductase [Anaerolineales bacterium]MDW8161954.1 SDR family oxidoreductase [Anaerolineales bacterium]MDW8447183.1 SDR family oxidoreductase [Anaerolineales bacterium]